jgi:hypothetical protein
MKNIETPEEEIARVSKSILKQMSKNPKFKAFVGTKSGSNNIGRGKNRSVILATQDGKSWFHYYKVWGKDNEKKAEEIINRLK